MSIRLRFAASLAAILMVAGCGGGDDHGDHAAGPANTANPNQTVDVVMGDNAFSPAQMSFPAGTTVKFNFTNQGRNVHEAVFGDEVSQEEHERQMVAQPHMHLSKANDYIELQPGDSGDLTWTFDKQGTTIIGCHSQEPASHWVEGMKITVNVT